YDIHKFGYYFELLRDVLGGAGFATIENLTDTENSLEHAPHHLEVRAIKQTAFIDPSDHPLYNHFQVNH
nr:hypothetical protein [Candidatus Moranbacteria bacterium]